MTNWRACEKHGDDNPNIWGCPECLRELRVENAALKERIAGLESADENANILIERQREQIDRLTAELGSARNEVKCTWRLYAAIHAGAARFAKILHGDKHIMTADTANGLLWDVAAFHGQRMAFEEAKQACAELRTGGHTDWRLPTVQELLTLVDYERSEPAINTEYFPWAKSNYYRASTPYQPHSGYAWGVGFGSGDSGALTPGTAYFVRAVRASQS